MSKLSSEEENMKQIDKMLEFSGEEFNASNMRFDVIGLTIQDSFASFSLHSTKDELDGEGGGVLVHEMWMHTMRLSDGRIVSSTSTSALVAKIGCWNIDNPTDYLEKIPTLCEHIWETIMQQTPGKKLPERFTIEA